MDKITNDNLENKEKYIKKMRELSDIVAKTGQLVPAFHKAYKDGNVDLFKSFINKYDLQEIFVQNSFDDLINFSNNEEKKSFINVAETEGLSYIDKVYGNEFRKSLEKLYEDGKLGIYDIYSISNINKSGDIEKQANIMTKILDLYNEDTLVIGIHRTGKADIGKNINKKGIKLTGDLSSGVVNIGELDIIEKLENNISFDYGPGLLLQEIAEGGKYKNYLNERLVDIPIVAIPEIELEEESEDIIIDDEELQGGTKLNPKYIRGYITVDSKNNTIENYVQNLRYLSNEKESDLVQENEDNLLEENIPNLEQKNKEDLGQNIDNKETSMTIYKEKNRFILWLRKKINNIRNKFKRKNKSNDKIDYTKNMEQSSSKKDKFINEVTKNGELKSKEEQEKQNEIAKKWAEQNKQEIEQENKDRNL